MTCTPSRPQTVFSANAQASRRKPAQKPSGIKIMVKQMLKGKYFVLSLTFMVDFLVRTMTESNSTSTCYFCNAFSVKQGTFDSRKFMGCSHTQRLCRDNQMSWLQWHSGSRWGRSILEGIFVNPSLALLQQQSGRSSSCFKSWKSLIKFNFTLKEKGMIHDLHWCAALMWQCAIEHVHKTTEVEKETYQCQLYSLKKPSNWVTNTSQVSEHAIWSSYKTFSSCICNASLTKNTFSL